MLNLNCRLISRPYVERQECVVGSMNPWSWKVGSVAAQVRPEEKMGIEERGGLRRSQATTVLSKARKGGNGISRWNFIPRQDHGEYDRKE